MDRWTLTIPAADNDGQSLAHVHGHVQRQLCASFGGYTSCLASGAWHSPTRGVQMEGVLIYTVDTADPCASDINRGLARYVKREGRQEAVYVTRHPITAELV